MDHNAICNHNDWKILEEDIPLTRRERLICGQCGAIYDPNKFQIFEDWRLTVKPNQIECRKQIGQPFTVNGSTSAIQGQVLLIVSKNGWKFNKQTGTSEVRLSMNNPCGMDLDELEGFVRVAKYAKGLLLSMRLLSMWDDAR